VFVDRFGCDLRMVSIKLPSSRGSAVVMLSNPRCAYGSSYLPTPRPASWVLRSCSLIFGLISAPHCFSHAKKVWLALSNSAMCRVVWCDVGWCARGLDIRWIFFSGLAYRGCLVRAEEFGGWGREEFATLAFGFVQMRMKAES
jgi:hypothetical protein